MSNLAEFNLRFGYTPPDIHFPVLKSISSTFAWLFMEKKYEVYFKKRYETLAQCGIMFGCPATSVSIHCHGNECRLIDDGLRSLIQSILNLFPRVNSLALNVRNNTLAYMAAGLQPQFPQILKYLLLCQGDQEGRANSPRGFTVPELKKALGKHTTRCIAFSGDMRSASDIVSLGSPVKFPGVEHLALVGTIEDNMVWVSPLHLHGASCSFFPY